MKRIAEISSECVACGFCMKICPMQAITVPQGIRAKIDEVNALGVENVLRLVLPR